jgi:4'-phosphopantetheinyl transferase
MEIYWLERTLGDVPPGEWWLSAEERGTLARLHVPKRRVDWRLGRWTAKCAIAALRHDLGDFAEIEIRQKESGAPAAFIRGRAAGFGISLSHSGGRGLCALTEREAFIGCDLECVEPRSPEFVADYFTLLEGASIAAREGAARIELLNLLWSAKESVSKALQLGLRMNLQAVDVLANDAAGDRGGWLGLAASTADDRVFHGWWRSAGGLVRTVLSEPRPAGLRWLAA